MELKATPAKKYGARQETASQRRKRKVNAQRLAAQGPVLQRKVRRNPLAAALRGKVL